MTIKIPWCERTVPLRSSSSAVVRCSTQIDGQSAADAMNDDYGVVVHIGAVSLFMSANQALDFGSALAAAAHTIADGVAKAFPEATSPATEGSPS